MNGEPVPPSARRRRRAFAARQLLVAHRDGALEEPSRWDWDTLGELPPWCLVGESERRTLQALCGLIFLGPELRSVLDGAVLRAAAALVGAERLERALDDALARFGEVEESPGGPGPTGALGTGEDEVAERLLGVGASVLYATLGERLESVLPLESLRRALGPALGTLDRATAERVLERAETLLEAGGGAPPEGRGDRAPHGSSAPSAAVDDASGSGASDAGTSAPLPGPPSGPLAEPSSPPPVTAMTAENAAARERVTA